MSNITMKWIEDVLIIFEYVIIVEFYIYEKIDLNTAYHT